MPSLLFLPLPRTPHADRRVSAGLLMASLTSCHELLLSYCSTAVKPHQQHTVPPPFEVKGTWDLSST
jgi:hypothetical protein